MLDKKALETMKDLSGNTILNFTGGGQKALFIKDGKFIIEDCDGATWEFERFEQACYFAVALRRFHNEEECYEDALTIKE